MRHLRFHVVHRAACAAVLLCTSRRQGVVLGRLIVGRRQEVEQQCLLRDLQQTEGLDTSIAVSVQRCEETSCQSARVNLRGHHRGLQPRSGTACTLSASGWLHLSGCTAMDSSRYRRRTAAGCSQSHKS